MQNDIPSQVKPNKLQFIGVGNLAQHKVYVDEVPIEDMLREGFWSSLVKGSSGDQLRPGDMLTIRQVKWADMSRDLIDKVLVRADCEILSTSRLGAVIAPLQIWNFAKEQVSSAEQTTVSTEFVRFWDPIARIHQVKKGDDVVYETKDKDEADAIVAGEKPVPQAA